MFTTLYDYWDQLFICVGKRRDGLGLNLLCHTCHEHLYKGKDNSNYGAKCLETQGHKLVEIFMILKVFHMDLYNKCTVTKFAHG